jgi:UDP-N-acetylglucosamine--N-acetylmuramyl-(pentapeptide) pyrophosphoryl-undecaprenol N-acetylglucosamine transferase
MVQRVCLVSGGTGGHLMPALVLARALRERGHEPVLVTEGREVEREILRRELPDVTEVNLPGGKPSRLAVPFWLARAILAARRSLRAQRVDCVVSTGGRPSLPVGLAARSLGIPLFLLEQNAVTGRANRWLLPFSRRIYHGLPAPRPADPRSLLTGTPLRPEFAHIDRALAQKELGLSADLPVVLVTGGSQGARSLNEIVPQGLSLLPFPIQVLHLSGLSRDEAVRRLYAATEGRIRAQVRPVALDMDRMFGAADLVICRGGGTTVAELTAAGRASIVVPYPHHRDQQQLRNAEVLANAGAACIVEERDLTAEGLAALVASLLGAPARLRAMGDAARRLRSIDPVGAILADMALQAGWLSPSPAHPASAVLPGGAR